MTTLYYVAVTIGWLCFSGYSSVTGWIVLIVLYLIPPILKSGGSSGSSYDGGGWDFDFGGGDSGGDCGGGDGGCD